MAERNEKKKKWKKKKVQNLDGLLPIEHEAGHWAGRWAGVGAGGARSRSASTALGGRRARLGVRVREDGCAGCVARSGRVGGRELNTGARARGERAHGRWARRRARTGAARARGRQARGAWQARGARPAWAWPGRSLCARAGPAGLGWGFVHSDSVFWPGSTRYFS